MSTPQAPISDPTTASVPTVEVNAAEGRQEKEKGIKKFWPFNKKKDDKAKDKTTGGLTSDYSTRSPRSSIPVPVAAGMSVPTSPARGHGGASPKIASPASSQIFERNVQEESLAPTELPTAIPNHIATENHIPPALDASSKAITDEKLSPDNVEIFTHLAHTPAAVSVAQGTTGAGSISGVAPSGMMSDASMSPTLPATSDEAAAASRSPLTPPNPVASALPTGLDDGASSYGALDSTDVRRLSFISFADVVHAEQSQSVGGSDAGGSTTMAPGNLSPSPGLTSAVPTQTMSPSLNAASPIISSPLRSASPIRAPSPGRTGSPNLSASNAGSPKIVGANPNPPTGVMGDLAVETMSQALRRTGSGDVGAASERDALSSGGGADGLGLGTTTR